MKVIFKGKETAVSYPYLSQDGLSLPGLFSVISFILRTMTLLRPTSSIT